MAQRMTNLDVFYSDTMQNSSVKKISWLIPHLENSVQIPKLVSIVSETHLVCGTMRIQRVGLVRIGQIVQVRL